VSLPRRQLFLSLLYGCVRILFSAVWPYILYHFLQKNHNNNAAYITWLSIGVIGMFTIGGIAAHMQSKVNASIMQEFSLKLGERIWKKMNSIEWLVFHNKNRVYFFDMMMIEAWRLRQGMAALLEMVIVNTVLVLVLALTILLINVPMFIVCSAGLLLTAGLHFYSTTRVRPYLKKFHNAWREQHFWVAATVDQFDLLKMGRGYQRSAARNNENTQVFLATNKAMVISQSRWRAINQVCINLVRVVIFITGIYWVQVGYINFTSLLLVLLIVSVIQNNMANVPAAIVSFMEGQEAAKTIAAFFELPSEDDAAGLPLNDIPKVDTISINNVSFSYGGNAAINNICVRLEKGKIYLWHGANGSGKSTTAHILLGLLQPQHGKLCINGKETAWEELKALRSRFAFLHQDAPMFTGTIKDNVLFGHPSPAEAWAGLTGNWLSALLPGGPPELRRIGEKGEGLSGGEARRIALIREWLRSSDLIILDEPLNHLDEYAISEIKKEVVNAKNNAIIIIISHQEGFENIADEIKWF